MKTTKQVCDEIIRDFKLKQATETLKASQAKQPETAVYTIKNLENDSEIHHSSNVGLYYGDRLVAEIDITAEFADAFKKASRFELSDAEETALYDRHVYNALFRAFALIPSEVDTCFVEHLDNVELCKLVRDAAGRFDSPETVVQPEAKQPETSTLKSDIMTARKLMSELRTAAKLEFDFLLDTSLTGDCSFIDAEQKIEALRHIDVFVIAAANNVLNALQAVRRAAELLPVSESTETV